MCACLQSARAANSVCSLPRLRGRVGERVRLPHINLCVAPPLPPPPPRGGGDRTESAASLCLSTNDHALQLVRRAAIAFEIGVFEKAARLFETFLVRQHVAFVGMLLV